MQIEWLGAIAITLGALTLVIRGAFPAYLFFASTLFGAGAALILPSLGYSNIQPAHLLLGFLLIYSVLHKTHLERIRHTLWFNNEGFYLLLAVMYSVASSLILPRLFSGSTYVYTIARTAAGAGIVAIPLAPSASNITQTVYFIGDFICFLIFYGFSSRPGGLKSMLHAALACSALNLGFAALDLITYFTGTSHLMAFIRNANYQMWDETLVVGFKRIVGSFPEASTFAATTVGLFAFSYRLLLEGIYKKFTLPLSLLSFAALVFATSSTGYAAIGAVIVLLYIGSVIRILTRRVAPASVIFAIAGPFMIFALVSAVALHQPTRTVVEDLASTMIVNKLSSSSGEERVRWNEQALRNFADTSGLGAGVGSVRASSFPVAVLGSIGIPGALAYGAFLLSVLTRRRDRWRDRTSAAIQAAARAACLGQLLAACVAGGFIDLGLQFFIFAGMACAAPGARSHLNQATAASSYSIKTGGAVSQQRFYSA